MAVFKKADPFLSVIIVSYKADDLLKNCLNSLSKQTYKNFEVVIVNNNPLNRNELILKKFPELKFNIVNLGKNYGFAYGNNEGFAKSKGDLILLLNDDTVIPPAFLGEAISLFSNKPDVSIFQPKLVSLRNQDLIDSAGIFWSNSTFLYSYGVGKNSSLGLYNKDYPVFAGKGACLVIRRVVIEKISLFDGDFWCYFDDIDFCHRAWLAGFSVWYSSKPICLHLGGATSTYFSDHVIQFHGFKNKLLMYLKNLNFLNLLWFTSIFLIVNTLLSIVFVLQGRYSMAISYYKALIWNFKNLKATLEKRKSIQKLRKFSDRKIFSFTKFEPHLSYYFFLFLGFDNLKEYKDDPVKVPI